MDPFLSWQSTDVPSLKDPSRYLPIKTMPLENLQDSGGVTNPFQISDANTVTQGTSNTSGNGVSLTTGASFNIGGFGFSTKTTDSWTWSITESTAQISTTAQTASATLASNTPNCCANTSSNGVCEVDIYEDVAFRTFAFQPEPETCAVPSSGPQVWHPILTGTVICDLQPCRELVTIEDATGKVLRRVFTDSKGRYAVGSLQPGAVKVMIRVADQRRSDN